MSEKNPRRPNVNFKVEAWVDIKTLKEHPRNPRKDLALDKDQFSKLKESLKEGVYEPIKVSKLSGFCFAGNQRLKAFKDLGYEEVPVQYNDYKNEKDEIRDMIKDNNNWGEYMYENLGILIEDFDLEINDLGLSDLDISGLDPMDLDDEEDYDDDLQEKELKKIKCPECNHQFTI